MLASRPLVDRRRRREVGLTAVAALFVLQITRSGQLHLASLLEAAVVASAVVALVVRRPVAWAAGMVVYVPLQQFLLAALWSAGLPAGVCRGLGFVKEAVVAGLLAAALSAPRRRLTAADRAVIALVLLVGLYFVMPTLFPGTFGNQPVMVRVSAARTNLLFFAAFLALRHLRIGARDVRLLENALLWMGFALSLGGVWELVAQSNYDHVLTDVVRIPAFTIDVLNGTFHDGGTRGVLVYNQVGSHSFVRNGGLLADALTQGFTLVTPFLVGVRRLLADGPRWATATVTALTGLVLFDTLTRSAVLAAVLGVVVLVAGGLRRRERGALAIAAVAAALLLLTLPFLAGSSVGERVAGAVNGSDQSTTAHQQSTGAAFFRSLHLPLGTGLGSNSGTGTQQDSTIAANTEDAYLQVSLELGWAGLLLFLVAYVAGMRDVAAIVRRGPPSPAAAALAAGTGLFAAGFFLPVWIGVQPAVTFWAFAGACCALGATEREAATVLAPPSLGPAPPRAGARRPSAALPARP